MRPTAHLLTCAGREGALADTLADFARTDWPEAPRAHAVLPEPDDPTGSTGRGHLHLLRAALDGPGTHFLLLEDDLLFNRHLHHNLLHWSIRAWRDRVGAALDLFLRSLWHRLFSACEPASDAYPARMKLTDWSLPFVASPTRGPKAGEINMDDTISLNAQNPLDKAAAQRFTAAVPGEVLLILALIVNAWNGNSRGGTRRE